MSRLQVLDLNMMKQIYNDNTEMITLYESEENNLFLLVTCGGTGLYEVVILLNDVETENLRTHGDIYLNLLSKDISKNLETKYKDRCFYI